MTGVGQDLRGAIRLFARQPVLALSVAVTLAFGIGFSVVLFTLLYGFAFRALDVHDPKALVVVYTSSFRGPSLGGSSYPDFLAFQEDGAGVVSLAAATRISGALGFGDDVVPLSGQAVSGNYFLLLGVRPHAGRLLQPDDDRADAPPALVLSHAVWRRRLGGDSSVIGRALTLGHHAFTVAGIAPPGFGGLTLDAAPEFWIAAAHQALATGEPGTLTERGARVFQLYGRLAPGMSVERARAAIDLSAARLHAAYPDAWTDQHGQRRSITVLRRRESLLAGDPGVLARMVGGLAGVVGLVLLVVSSNVASLLLAHAATRQREVSIRAALGASRRRLARQRMIETLALATAGGILGTLAAVTALDVIAARWPEGLPRLTLSPNAPVFAFAALLVGVATVLAGAAPAIQAARTGLARMLNAPAPIHGRRRGGMRGVLIAGQLGFSSALLAVTGLLLQSNRNAARIDPGFSPRDVVTAFVELPSSMDSLAGRAFYGDVVRALEADPAVAAVAAAWTAPQSGSRVTATLRPDQGEDLTTEVVGITPRYFDVLSIPMVAGRAPGSAELAAGSVAVVSETLARRIWPDGAIGRTLRLQDGAPLEVVGVARDAALFSIAEPRTVRVFVPTNQFLRGRGTILVRASAQTSAARDAMRRAIRLTGPRVAISGIQPLPDVMARQTAPQRALAGLTAAAGGLELLLAAIALAGLVAFWTAQRTREIGLRLALGATRDQVLQSLMHDGLRLAAIGTAVGVVAAFGTHQVTRRALIAVGPFEPGPFALAITFLALVAALATYLPARRAVRLDAMEALRHE
jgi:predicted permease